MAPVSQDYWSRKTLYKSWKKFTPPDAKPVLQRVLQIPTEILKVPFAAQKSYPPGGLLRCFVILHNASASRNLIYSVRVSLHFSLLSISESLTKRTEAARTEIHFDLCKMSALHKSHSLHKHLLDDFKIKGVDDRCL